MEAPVPASALIHSATLVSAGIFLLLRFSPLFELSTFSFYLIGIVGSVTAFYGGFSSMFQSDTKKILAYSTISHCGFLMVVYTTGVIEYVLLYLYIHGFFKAAVFMCVGNVNRLSKNNQDFKRMGMYYKFLPFDCYLTFVGLMNLSGLPFTLGFYIKHLLLISLNYNYIVYYIIIINCFFGALTGIYYSSRLFYYVFFDFKKSKKNLYLYYSASNLNSKFYSNTSLASNIAISLIFLLSYVLGFFLLNFYLSNDFFFSSFFSYYSLNSQLISFLPSNLELFNFGYINYFVFVFIVFVIFNT
jgi:NADH:ubiquinone oxidoreductase subunit 5 (subunit L)/multisubunit Na+/H+ antiporter MnhA subunit